MPRNANAVYEGYYHCSAECWSVYADVLGFEFANAVVFRQVHQLTVDTYAVQHAGGGHPDKSIAVHLAGLHAAFDLNMPSIQIPRLLQRLAECVDVWPHFPPPDSTGPVNALAVALACSPQVHVERVRKWSRMVWIAWSFYHRDIAAFVHEFR